MRLSGFLRAIEKRQPVDGDLLGRRAECSRAASAIRLYWYISLTARSCDATAAGCDVKNLVSAGLSPPLSSVIVLWRDFTSGVFDRFATSTERQLRRGDPARVEHELVDRLDHEGRQRVMAQSWTWTDSWSCCRTPNSSCCRTC